MLKKCIPRLYQTSGCVCVEKRGTW